MKENNEKEKFALKEKETKERKEKRKEKYQKESTPETEKKYDYQDVLATIMTHNVNISNEEYERMLTAVGANYDNLHSLKQGEHAPTLDERRKRIEMNYYGTSINFLYSIYTALGEFINQYTPLIEAIASKVGVDFEKVETPEEQAMKAAANYLNASAKAKSKSEATKKTAGKASKTGKVIKFDKDKG